MIIKNSLILSAILISSFFVSGCSPNSAGGYTWGGTQSPAWYATIPANELKSHFDNQAIYELCIEWERNYPGGTNMWSETRKEISKSLLRRGENSLYCSNPSADQTNIANKKTREAQAATRRAKAEAARAQQQARQACEAARQAYRSCRNSGSTYCRRANC